MKMLDFSAREDQAPPMKIELSTELKATLELRIVKCTMDMSVTG